jgi:uncharacterized protein
MKSNRKSFDELLEEHKRELRYRLEEIRRLSADEIASQIKKIGFECIRCGECCNGDDNSVVAFPFEIRKILKANCIGWLDAVEPPTIGEWDDRGCFHTLEWRIRRAGGSCKFYNKGVSEKGQSNKNDKSNYSDFKNDGHNTDDRNNHEFNKGRCMIYRDRPILCRTYPFYLDGKALCTSLCPGLDGNIELNNAYEIALRVKERAAIETEEALSLLEKYSDFKRGNRLEDGDCIVHDSEGEHLLARKDLRDFMARLAKI